MMYTAAYAEPLRNRDADVLYVLGVSKGIVNIV